ncbi:acetyltransferase [Lacticaseibacillus casei]|uniref:GNAT family N-acetyltransferase n=2 Tax=Lacticaseibacillus zeae TaxID=57037 RepID=A0A5R8M1Q1_LACZE|nr:GNAT family N-acetyltransferase [Lacticaseibacillus zeae]OLS09094.1 acetyltransferase [Lacticaseibacillus casei]QVI32972.1 GNAT family N-acetyltransferase [Lacticaseibacillus zeae]TLF43506.1 GNAT family N-acetyltransferase [Lacticaseibacillus zeae]
MATRRAMPEDIPHLLPLVQGYYHDSPVPLTIDPPAMAAHLERLRTDSELGYLLVTELDEQLAGFAILYRSFDTRTLKPLLIINNVYVAPKFRRHGLARQLMTAAFDLATDEGFTSANWQTRTSNLGAQHLYDQIGERETGWLHYHHVIPDA